MVKRWAVAAALVGLGVGVALAAPRVPVVWLNGALLQAEARWVEGRLFIPLEEAARSTGGSYLHDVQAGEVRAEIRAAGDAEAAEAGEARVKVLWERRFLSGSNARVAATIENVGTRPARSLEALCVFKDDNLREVGVAIREVGRLEPGERRTLEFSLFDTVGPAPAYPVTGYYTAGGQWVPVLGPGSAGLGPEWLLIQGQWTRIRHELRFHHR